MMLSQYQAPRLADDAAIADITSLRAHSMHSGILRQRPRVDQFSGTANSAAVRELPAHLPSAKHHPHFLPAQLQTVLNTPAGYYQQKVVSPGSSFQICQTSTAFQGPTLEQ